MTSFHEGESRADLTPFLQRQTAKQNGGVAMTKITGKMVLIITIWSIMMIAPDSFGGQKYHDFRLGKHVIDGNEIEFTFPMPPPSATFYLFSSQWQLKRHRERARLVVKLYDISTKISSAPVGACG